MRFSPAFPTFVPQLRAGRLVVAAAFATVFCVGTADVASAARPVNAALVTQIVGKVTYRLGIEGASAAPARAFAKARSTDIYSVPAGATLRLVYLDSGRQETWNGPVEIIIGTSQSTASGDAAATVAQLPPAGVRGIRRVPSLLKQAGTTRLGAHQVRGADDEGIEWRGPDALTPRERARLADARKQYKALKKVLPADDPTADYYLIGALGRLRLRAALESAVDDALKRFPKDETLVRINRWLRPPVEKPEEPAAGAP